MDKCDACGKERVEKYIEKRKRDYLKLAERKDILLEKGNTETADKIIKEMIDKYPYELYEDVWSIRPEKLSDLRPEHQEGAYHFMHACYTNYDIAHMTDKKYFELVMENMSEWWYKA